MHPPAQYVPFSGSASPGALVAGRVVLMGFSFEESAGAVASWTILDGLSTNAVELFRINLNAIESTREWFGPMGIACEQGLFVRRISGSTIGTLFYVAETRLGEGMYEYVESLG